MRAHSASTAAGAHDPPLRPGPARRASARAASPRDRRRGGGGDGGGGGGRELGPAPQRRAGAPGPRRAEPLLLPLGVKMAARGTWSSPGA